jgi:hypothetical protein
VLTVRRTPGVDAAGHDFSRSVYHLLSATNRGARVEFGLNDAVEELRVSKAVAVNMRGMHTGSFPGDVPTVRTRLDCLGAQGREF